MAAGRFLQQPRRLVGFSLIPKLGYPAKGCFCCSALGDDQKVLDDNTHPSVCLSFSAASVAASWGRRLASRVTLKSPRRHQGQFAFGMSRRPEWPEGNTSGTAQRVHNIWPPFLAALQMASPASRPRDTYKQGTFIVGELVLTPGELVLICPRLLL